VSSAGRGGPGHDETDLVDPWADTVEIRKPPPRARPEPAPATAAAYAWPEAPVTGLRTFNLGTIPASVTPPRTWRRAAWFAVSTAGLVVVALGFATVQLVGHPRRNYTIDALPGQPSQRLLITDLPIPAPNNPVEPKPTTVGPTVPAGSGTPGPTRAKTSSRSIDHRDVVTEASGRQTGTGEPVRPTTRPPRSTIEAPLAVLAAPADPDELGDRTELYYANVCHDPEAAYELTAGAMRAEGPEGITARYGTLKRIVIRQITIDPSWSVTRSTMTVVRDDGSSVTIQRELTFSSGSDPRITSDTDA
jgi:hypothetical protein